MKHFMLIIFVIIAFSSILKADEVFYDITFSSPEHTVGHVPVTGSSPTRPSQILFGAPIVSSSLGLLQNQPLVFNTTGNPPSFYYDQIRLIVGKNKAFYYVAFDVLTQNLIGSTNHFVLIFDTPSVRNIVFRNNGTIYIRNKGDNRVIGHFTENTLMHCEVYMDMTQKEWTIFVNNNQIHSGLFQPDNDIENIRFSLGLVSSATSPDHTTNVGLDNIIVADHVVSQATPPVADADGPYTIYVGDTLTLDASGSTDVYNDIVSYVWDLDDNGSFETDAGGQPVFDVNYASLQSLGLIINYTYNIHLKVTDSEGQSDVNDSTLTIIPKPEPMVYYVDTDATGANNGSSWADAFNNLQDALAVAKSGDEIRVAQGIYKPDEDSAHPGGTGNREATFQLKNGITIKGSYAGFGEPVPDTRDIDLYETILSGDLNGDDGPDFSNNGENSYHVVTAIGNNAATLLDGITITQGNAGGNLDQEDVRMDGGGMYCRNSGSGPTIINCNFRHNLAYDEGAGICNSNLSSPILINCLFFMNQSGIRPHSHMEHGSAGGLFNTDGSNSILINCSFIGNSAYGGGGGIRNVWSDPILINCMFSGNSASCGGGMRNILSKPTLTNCTFSGNSASIVGGGMENFTSKSTLSNCIFWGNTDSSGTGESAQIHRDAPTVNYSCIQGWTGSFGGTGNMGVDPCFVQPGYFGPISYWKFDEASGTTAHDSVGDNHGTLINGPTWTTGQVAAALSFDGMDDCVDVPDFPDLNPQVFTVEAWIKTSATYYFETFGTILVKGRVFDENYGLFVYESGWVRWQYTSGGVWGDTSKYEFLDSSKVVNDDQFHHIVGTYDGEELKLYIDGSLDSSRAETKVPDKNNLSLRIGRRNNPGDLPWHSVVPFDGLIDEVAIYDRVLSDDEIQQHYQNGSSGQAYPDAVKPDYRLLSGSPCINTGDPNYIPEPDETDLDGNPRVIGGRIDMGVYEFNHIPVADAGQDRTVEAQAPWGATVTLDASGSSDADSTPGTNDDINDFNWYKLDPCDPNADVFLGSGQIIDCNLSIGEHIIVLEVIDKVGASDTNEVTIIVQDTTPPQFQLSVAPTMLWPPDHKMYEITPSWTVSDECDATPDVSLVSIVANEGDDTIGDGHTSNDIQIGEDGSIYLRSERSGTSDDRVYTITYQAVDDCGNATVRSATVSIPHDFKVLARIASRWLWAGPGRIPEDLNSDGVVNLKDIAIFANNWIQ